MFVMLCYGSANSQEQSRWQGMLWEQGPPMKSCFLAVLYAHLRLAGIHCAPLGPRLLMESYWGHYKALWQQEGDFGKPLPESGGNYHPSFH